MEVGRGNAPMKAPDPEENDRRMSPDGDRLAMAAAGALNPKELADLGSTADILRPIAPGRRLMRLRGKENSRLGRPEPAEG